MSGAARALPPKSANGGAGHLNDASLLGPLDYALQVFAKNRITLGVGEHGSHTTIAKLCEAIGSLRRHAVIIQLDQHVTRLPDGITSGIGKNRLQVVVGKMEIAAQDQPQLRTDERLQMIDQRLQISAVVVIAIVSVRRSNLMRDAIGGGHAAHGDRSLPRLGAVVYFRKNVRVNIDHDLSGTQSAAGCCVCCDLSRFAGKEEGARLKSDRAEKT